MLFEGIAKTNTTHTMATRKKIGMGFEGIAKTNTTHTINIADKIKNSLRVLLKQIQHTLLNGSSPRFPV